jgi:hypothetical protein
MTTRPFSVFPNPRAPAWAGAAGLAIDFTTRNRDSGKEKVKKW